MTRKNIGGIFLLVSLVLWAFSGCDKEKIVESTEYIHDIEYRQLPPETIFQFDTLIIRDSNIVSPPDTIYQIDTLRIMDTFIVNTTDTIRVYDTIVQTRYIHDTVTVVQHHHDTVVTIDTVRITQFSPNEYLAIAALQYYSDPLVFEFIYDEFGYDDGWVFYLSTFQLDVTARSSGVYDIYGYIDYWTPDWTGYYPLEFYWRMIYKGGDPANPANWEMGEPVSASFTSRPGMHPANDARQSLRTLH